MKTGIELIAIERQEQIEKHGFTLDADVFVNTENQLAIGAIRLISGDIEAHQRIPEDWNWTMWKYMCRKSYKERLIIAGALIAAEIDRLQAIEP